MSDLISRQAAIKAICEDGTWLERQGCVDITMAERKQRDVDILEALPTSQPEILAYGEGELNVPDTNVGDMISRQAAIEAICKTCLMTEDYHKCDGYPETSQEPESGLCKRFVTIETAWTYLIVADRETGVMYAVSYGGYNCGTFTLLVDKDGNPLIWDGE